MSLDIAVASRWPARSLRSRPRLRRHRPRSGADFFNGKTITYIVATSPGGGYDTYGRLVAEYMQRYLPGSTFVVQQHARRRAPDRHQRDLRGRSPTA